MEDLDDDFGELYADVEVQASLKNNGESDFSQLCAEKPQHNNKVEVDRRKDNDSGEAGGERRQNDSELGNNGDMEEDVKNGSESDDDDDDDFDVFVNDEDLGAKSGGGDERRCSEEVAEDMVAEFVGGVMEGNLTGKNQMRVDVHKMEQNGNGGSCGGERGDVGKNGSNSQCKYLRRNGSGFVGNQRAVSSWKADREDVWYGQSRVPGFAHGSAGNGNSFWLPWYRTIVDVDIDTIEQKCWTYPGADVTDYFNFGFDEKSWRNYSRSLDQVRRQMLGQSRNQVNESLRFRLENEAGADKELHSDEFVGAESTPSGFSKLSSHELDFAARHFKQQIGQAIHVEDSNTERLPSADTWRPRDRDSDVVIQITMQDLEEPSSSGNEVQNIALETKCEVSEKGCGHTNTEMDAETSSDSKAYEMGKICPKENFRSSSVSSDCKRSLKSAAVSCHLRQYCIGHEKDQNAKLDVQPSGKDDTFSGGLLSAIDTLNSLMEDVDSGSDTTETNPRVAGLDVSFDDRGPSSHSPSYSNTWSEASKDDRCDSRRIRDLRRSSSNSKKNNFQGANVDYECSRSNRDDKNHSRVRNPSEKNLKHIDQRLRRHMEVKSRSGVDDNHRLNIGEHYRVGRSRALRHRRSQHWCPASTSDNEYWHSCREDESSPGFYDRGSADNWLQEEGKRGFGRRDRWGSSDEGDLYFQREWNDEQFFFDRRMQRKGVIDRKDWRFQERECMVRDDKPYFRNQHHFMLKFSSSQDVNWFEQRREHDDIHFDKRSKHEQPLHHRYTDEPLHKRYGRPNPLDYRRSKYFDSEIEHEISLWGSGRDAGTSDRDEYLESPLDDDYARNIVDDEYWNEKAYTSTHDDHDAFPTYGLRKRLNTLYRDDEDNLQLDQRYERHGRSISSQKGISSRQVYGCRRAYNRQDGASYFDEDDFFEKRQNAFHSKGVSWTEDAQFDEFSDNNFCGGNMLNPFKGVPRRKWHGVKRGFGPGRVTMHLRGRFELVGGGANSKSKLSELSPTATLGINSVELRHTFREKKSTGKYSKAGPIPNNDACEHADGRFRGEFMRRKEQDKAFLGKMMDNKEIPVRNRDNASDVEEGQIPAEERKTGILMGKKFGSGHVAKKDNLNRSCHSQILVSQNDSCAYDENRILETRAKMEKRRERFKDPIFVNKDSDADLKPEEKKIVEMAESTGQRPVRKRKWGGS